MVKIGIPYSGCEHISEIPCSREDEAVAFACGIAIGGGKPFVFMQDNGFLLALDVILGLHLTYEIDFEIAVKNRIEPIHHFMTGVFWYNIREKISATVRAYQENYRIIN